MNKLARRSLLSIITLSALYAVSDARASDDWEDDWPYDAVLGSPFIADVPYYTPPPMNPFDGEPSKTDFSAPLEPLFDGLAEDFQTKIAKQAEVKAKTEAEEADAIDHKNTRLAAMMLSNNGSGSVQETVTFLEKLIKDDKNPYAAFMMAELYRSSKILCVAPAPAEPVTKKGRGRKKKVEQAIPQVTPQQQYVLNQNMARQFFETADIYGHPDAKFHLAGLWSSGVLGFVDLQKTFDLLCAGATVGHLDSTHSLGLWYQHQASLTKDREAAEVSHVNAWIYFWQAAQSNYMPSILELAHILREGKGATQDHEMAFRYYLQVLEHGTHELKAKVDSIYLTEQLPYMPANLKELAYKLGLINFNPSFEMSKSGTLFTEVILPSHRDEEDAVLQETSSRDEAENPLKRGEPETDVAEVIPNSASNSSLTEGVVEPSQPEPVAPIVTNVSKSDAIENYKGPRQSGSSTAKKASGTKRAKRK